MLVDPNPSNGGQTPANVISGEAGLEDVVNSAQPNTSTNPDGVKEAATYYTYSPEDVDQNGFLDNWGGKNIGYGFNVNTNTAPAKSVPHHDLQHDWFEQCGLRSTSRFEAGRRRCRWRRQ